MRREAGAVADRQPLRISPDREFVQRFCSATRFANMPIVMPYEITILAAGVQRTLMAETEGEAALMAEAILLRFEGKAALIGFWIDAPDRGALKRLGAYLTGVLAEITSTGELVVAGGGGN